jgi:hypothetical protein
MSTRIGVVPDVHNSEAIHVLASRGGVELYQTYHTHTLTPIEARNYAALLVRASEEAERMQSKIEQDDTLK